MRFNKLNILMVISFIVIMAFISGVTAADVDVNNGTDISGNDTLPLDVDDVPVVNNQSNISINMELHNTTLNKSVSNVNIGENVTYLINISLANNTTYENVSVKDILPDGFVYSNAVFENGTSVTPIVNGQIITFEFLNVNSTEFGENLVIYLTATVANTEENIRGSKTNLVNLTSNSTFIKSVSSDINIVEPNLNMTMSFDKDQVQGGDNVTLSINVTNIGDSDAYNVTLNDIFDSLYNNYANMSTLTINGVGNVTDLDSFYIGTIAPGATRQITINFNVTDDIIIGNTYTSDANVVGASIPYVTNQTRNYTTNTTSTFTTLSPNVEKTVSTTDVRIGDNVTYCINVTLPTGMYNNITIHDILPDGFAYVYSNMGNNSITPTAIDGNIVTFTFINVNATEYDGNILLYITGTVTDDKDVNNAGMVKTNIVNLISNNTFINTDDVSVTIVEPIIDMTIGFNDTNVQGGTNITLSINVTNFGNSDAYNTTVRYDLINNYVNGSNVIITIDGNEYTITESNYIDIGTINPNTTKHVLINFIVKDDIIIGNSYYGSATVLAYSIPISTDDTRVYRDYGSDSFTTDKPSMDKTVQNGVVVIGESVNYYINVTLPRGNYTNITIIDDLPKGLIIKDAKINGTSIPFNVSADGRKVTFEFINLSSYDYDNQLVINVINIVENIPSNVDGVVLTNNATLISDNNFINKDDASVTIKEPEISIIKIAPVKEAQVNKEITFEFIVSNTGNATATGVYIIDDLNGLINEKDLKKLVATCNGENLPYKNDGKKYKIEVGNVEVGETKHIIMKFILDKDIQIYKNYTNVADVVAFSSDNKDYNRNYTDVSNDSFVVNITSMPYIYINHYDDYDKSYDPMSADNPFGVLIGENVEYEIHFNNVGVINGYNTVVDLIVPDSISEFTASYIGNKINVVKGTDLGNGTWYDPVNKAYVDVPEGQNLFILEVPVGGFTNKTPHAEIVINTKVSNNLNNTDLINITAIPFFQFGNDYAGEENSIRGNSTNAYIKPVFIDINKYSSLNGVRDDSGKVATGYTWRFPFYVTVNLVDGVSYTKLVLTDNLPSNLKYIPSTFEIRGLNGVIPSEAYEVSYPEDMGGQIIVNFKNPVNGTSRTTDITFTYMVYAPEFDNTTDDLKEIINNITGARNITVNNAVIDYSIDKYDVKDNVSDNYTVILESLKITKGVYDNNNTHGWSGYTGPGDKITYTLHYEISDYFNFTEFFLNDTVGGSKGFDQRFDGDNLELIYNGNSYIVNSSYFEVYNLTNGKWGIVVYISKFYNDTFGSDLIKNGTSGSIKFNVTVNSLNHKNETIESMYRISNIVVGEATLPSGRHVTDSESTYMVIDAPKVDSKSIKYINGQEQGQATYYDIYTDDNITFLLEFEIPNSIKTFELTDYVTIPIFTIDGFNVAPGEVGQIPKAGNWAFADSDYILYDIDGNVINPVVSIDKSTNGIVFKFDNVYKSVQNTTTVRIYLTLNVQNYFLADGLFKPNLIRIDYDGVNQNNYPKQKVVWMLLNEPVLNINKTVNNTIIKNGDTVTYTVTVSNTGHANAYNVIIADDLLDEYKDLIKNGTVTDFRAVYGNGTVINIDMDYFNSTKGFDFGTLGFDETTGNNFTIYYTVTFNSCPVPGSLIVNTANVIRYASMENGTNFIDNKPLFSNATLDTYRLDFTKEYMGSNDFNTTGDTRKQELYIGESAVFNLTAWLPQLDVVNLTFEDFAPQLGFYKYEIIFGDGLNHDNVTVNKYVFNHKDGDLVRIAVNGTLLANGTVNNFVTVLLYYVVNETYFDNGYEFNQTNKANLYYNYTLSYSEKDDFLNNTLKKEFVDTTYLSDKDNYTIVQSNLTFESKVNVTSVEGGDVVKITYNGTTIGNSVLFNTTINSDFADLINNFVINQDVRNINVTIVSGNETGKAKVYWNGTNICIDFGDVEGNNSLVAELTFVVKPDVVLGDKYNNTAFMTAGSMPDNRYNETRYYSDNDTFAFDTLTYFDAEKLVINTSAGNDKVNVSYGEIITYAVNITVPKGFVNITISDVLPEGIDLIDGSLVLSDGTILTADNYTLKGRQLNIILNVVVTETPLVLYYNATVVNDLTKNPVGQNKVNTATVTWFNETTSTANVTIVSPNVTITKDYNVTLVEGNDAVTLIINATNTGNSILYNTTIKDDLNDLLTKFTIKDDLSIVVISGNETGDLTKEWNGNTLTFNLDKFGAGESIVINITFNIKSDVRLGLNHTNTVDVVGYSVAHGVDNYIRSFTDNATDGFDTKTLDVNKTVFSTDIINNKTDVLIGEDIVYAINATVLTGGYDVLVINDTLPDGFKFKSVMILGNNETVISSNYYVVNYDEVNNVVNIIFNNDFAQEIIYNQNKYFTAYITATVLNSTENKASTVPKVNKVTYYWNNKNATDNASIIIIEPKPSVDKTVNDTVVEGNNSVSYEITAANNGNSILYNATLVDDLNGLIGVFVNNTDDITVYVDDIVSNEFTWNGTILTVNFNNMDSGIIKKVKLVFKVRSDVVIGSSFKNTAVLSGYSLPIIKDEIRLYSDEDTADMVATEEPSIVKNVNGTNVTKSVRNVTIGEEIYYIINVTMPTGNYTNVTITDVLPEGFAYLNSTFLNGTVVPYKSLSADNRTVVFEFNNVHSSDFNGNLVINLTALVKNTNDNKIGNIKTNKVTLNYPGNNNSSAKVTIVEPNVSVSKTVNNTNVKANDSVYYEITVKNTGNSILYNASILDDLNGFIEVFVSSTDDIQIFIDGITADKDEYNWNNNKLNVTLDKLNPGEIKKVKLVFKVKSNVHIGDEFDNNVDVVGYSIPDSYNARNYTDSDNVGITTVGPSITKEVNKTNVTNDLKHVTIGETIDYMINVTLPAGKYSNITIVDELPDGLTYVSAHYLNGTEVPIKSISVDNRTITIYYADIHSTDFGGHLVINLTALVNNVSSNKNGVVKVNNASYTINNKFTDDATASVTIIEPNLTINKSADKSKYNVTEKAEYTIVIENKGTTTAYNINVTDIIEKGLIYNGEIYTSLPWNVSFNSTSKTLTILGDELKVNEKFTLKFNTTFDQSLSDILGKDINNIANVTYTSMTGENNRTYQNSDDTEVRVVVCDLSVEKVATSEIYAGREVTYTITVTNAGPDIAYDVTLKDIFNDTYLSNVKYSFDNGKWYDYDELISLGALDVNEIKLIYIKALLNSSAVGTLNNTAVVSTPINETSYENNKDSNITKIISHADLNVYKQDNITDAVIAGTNIGYTVTVENREPATAFNVTLADYFDVTQLLNMEYSTDNVTWTAYTNGTVISLGDMLPNTKVTFYFRALVNASSRGIIVNVANITTDTKNMGINSSTEITPIITDNSFKIDKTANVDEISPSEYMSYIIEVTSEGHSNSFNVNLNDVLDTNLLDTSSAVYTLNDVAKGSWTGTVNYGNMKPGDSFTIVISGIKVKKSADKDIYNEATVFSDEVPDGISDDVTVHLKTVDLAVTKTTNTTNGLVNLNEDFVYYITVINYGPDDSDNVIAKDLIEKGLIIKSIVSSTGTNYDKDTGVWTIGNLKNNQVVTLNITCKVNRTGIIPNIVSVTGTGYDTNLNNNKDEVNVYVAEYNITKIADDLNKVYSVGENVTYTITVNNTNNIAGNNVVVTDTFDQRLEFISSTGPNEAAEGNKVHWTFNAFDNGATMTFTATFKVIGSGIIPNTVSINNVSAHENITIVDLTVNKTTVDEIVNYNGTAVFIINVTNPTNGTARAVIITDVLGKGLKYVDSNLTTNRTVVSDSKVYWIVDVPSNGLLIKVYATTTDYGVLNNTVFVDDHNGVKNSTSFVKVAEYDISKEATDINDTYSQGEVVVYEIVVNNTNDIQGRNIEVTDKFDTNQLEFINSTGINEDATGKSNGIIKWIIPEMAKGEVYKFNVTFIVKSPENTIIVNTVSVNNVTTTENINVVGVTVTKTVNITNPNYGELVSFDIVVGNPYNTEIRNVTIKDVLSNGLEFVSTNYAVGFNDNDKSWNNLTIGPNGLIIKVIAKITEYGNLNNTVIVNDNNGVGDDKEAVAKVSVPEITITKDAEDKDYYIGDEITYNITITGDGVVNGTQVTVTDYLPAELTDIITDGTYNNENHTVTWIIDINPSETINLTVKGTFNGTGIIDNEVEVGNYTANKTVKVYDIVPVKTANVTDINVGQLVNYTINLTNVGDLDASNVTVKDLVPEGLEIINVTNDGKVDGEYIVWNLTISAQTTISVNVIAKVLESVELNNTVFVANKKSSNILQPKNFTIDKVNQNKTAVYLYDNIEYHIIINNTGAFDLVNKTIIDILPENLKFVSASNGGRLVDGNVVWNNISVGVNETLVLDIICKVVKEGNITNVVTVDEKTTNNTIDVDYICDVEITIDAPKEPVKVGEPFEVTITVTNHGPSTARDVIVNLTIKGPYKLSKFDPSKGTFTDVWDIGDLDCNETVVLKLTLIATGPGEITISVTVSTSTNETDYTNNNASATVIAEEDDNPDYPPHYNDGNQNENTMHATGNPLFALLVVLLCIPIIRKNRKD